MPCNCGQKRAPRSSASPTTGHLWTSADGKDKLVLRSSIEAEARRLRLGGTVRPVQK